MKGKKILLISYVFPPYPGVGGRRWAKFARCLTDEGYEVFVLCARNILPDKSPWTKDADHPHIHVTYLPAKYPAILEQQPATFFEKIRYRAWIMIFTFFSKGQIFERTLFWKKQLLHEAGKLIKAHDIPIALVTGPPFLLMHHASHLKELFPQLKLVSDFRDPWTDNTSFMGYATMSPQRLAFEKQAEQEVLLRSDIVLTVADKITRDLQNKISAQPGKVVTLPNGFDPAEIKVAAGGKPTSNETLDFVYAGNLYADLDYIFGPLTNFLAGLKVSDPSRFAALRFRFFGHVAPAFREMIRSKDISELFSFHNWISREEVGKEIDKADACLLFYTPQHGYAMNTKFFEYLAHRKPIVLFANEGTTSAFLETNRLGYWIDPLQMQVRMEELINDHFSSGLKIDPSFDISQYSIPSLTQQLIRILGDKTGDQAS